MRLILVCVDGRKKIKDTANVNVTACIKMSQESHYPLIGLGVSRQEFYQNYFEKKFLFAQNAIQKHAVTWEGLNEVVFRESDLTAIRLFKDGLLPDHQYTSKYQDIREVCTQLSREKVESYLAAGATLVVNRLDHKDKAIAMLCQALSTQLGLKVAANGYIAFGGDGTFGKHWDTHDVFAMQLLGRKRWLVYEPTFELPLEHQKSRAFKADCPAMPVFDQVLEPGDILYIPRGWWHEALPITGCETFHITAGAYTGTLIDYLTWIANKHLVGNSLARRSAIPGHISSEELQHFADAVQKSIVEQEIFYEFNNEMGALVNRLDLIDLTKSELRSFAHL